MNNEFSEVTSEISSDLGGQTSTYIGLHTVSNLATTIPLRDIMRFGSMNLFRDLNLKLLGKDLSNFNQQTFFETKNAPISV